MVGGGGIVDFFFPRPRRCGEPAASTARAAQPLGRAAGVRATAKLRAGKIGLGLRFYRFLLALRSLLSALRLAEGR